MDKLITTAVEKVHSLQGRINHLHLLHFPSGNPALLITLYSRIAQSLFRSLEEYRNDSLEATKNHNVVKLKSLDREVRLSVLLVKKIASQLRYVEGARVERTPWSFIG
jgi:murein L,D-transpeptidase YcbB/YkuD